jgi:hypothetical protein
MEVRFTNPLAVVASSTTFRDGSYYLEETDRSAGIKVMPGNGVGAVNTGDRAIFSGILGTDSATSERFISLLSITDKVAGEAVRPLGMTNKVITGVGVAPSALLVTTWGKVTYVDTNKSYMYIDDGSNANDGSGHAGIKVVLDAANDLGLSTAAVEGDHVSVTGVVRFVKVDDSFIPEILPRSAVEIDNNQLEHVAVHQSDFTAIGDTSDKQWRMEIRGDGVHAVQATAKSS